MDSLFSKTVKSGNTTYFFDVREAKNKSRFITIAESKKAAGEEKKFTRSSILVFDSSAKRFRDALEEAIQIADQK